MADSTAIEWADATFNPWWGCAEVSPGCGHCYARTWANWTRGRGLWPEHGQSDVGHAFMVTSAGYWRRPLAWARTLPAKLKRRPRVFCASMADVFEDVPELDEHRERLFELIDQTPELDWLVLTKRPEYARLWLQGRPVRPNVWLGVSIENARFTWRADVLREIPAAVRFISAEPLLSSLFAAKSPLAVRADRQASAAVVQMFIEDGMRGDDASVLVHRTERAGPNRSTRPLDLTGIDWVIVGGESGSGARPFHIEHAREIVRTARWMRSEARGAGEILGHTAPSVFVKQLGSKPVFLDDLTIGVYDEKPLKLRDKKGGDWDEWPADLRLREFPRSAVLA